MTTRMFDPWDESMGYWGEPSPSMWDTGSQVAYGGQYNPGYNYGGDPYGGYAVPPYAPPATPPSKPGFWEKAAVPMSALGVMLAGLGTNLPQGRLAGLSALAGMPQHQALLDRARAYSDWRTSQSEQAKAKMDSQAQLAAARQRWFGMLGGQQGQPGNGPVAQNDAAGGSPADGGVMFARAPQGQGGGQPVDPRQLLQTPEGMRAFAEAFPNAMPHVVENWLKPRPVHSLGEGGRLVDEQGNTIAEGNPKAAKSPTVHRFIEGGQEVDKVYDPTNPNADASGWFAVGRGPRFKPGKDNGGLSASQQRENDQIDEARRLVDQYVNNGGPEALFAASASNDMASGMSNPQAPMVKNAIRLATRKRYGEDNAFSQYSSLLRGPPSTEPATTSNKPPPGPGLGERAGNFLTNATDTVSGWLNPKSPPAPAAEVPVEQPGMFDRSGGQSRYPVPGNPMTPETTARIDKPRPPQAQMDALIQNARDALRQKAPRDSVIKRLRDLGIEPPPDL